LNDWRPWRTNSPVPTTPGSFLEKYSMVALEKDTS